MGREDRAKAQEAFTSVNNAVIKAIYGAAQSPVSPLLSQDPEDWGSSDARGVLAECIGDLPLIEDLHSSESLT